MKPVTEMMETGLDPNEVMGSAKTPIFLTSTFLFDNAKEMKKYFKILLGRETLKEGEKKKHIYTRFSNPNTDILEAKLTVIEEGAVAALAFPSGMSAIFTTVISLVKPGQIIIYTRPVYGCTEELFRTVCKKFGINAISVDTSNAKKVERILQKHGQQTVMLFVETPANPNLRHSDIQALADLARKYEKIYKHKIWVVVDNTFLGPVFQKPFLHGADIVIYSATKFLGGHSDLVAGAVLTKSEQIIKVIKAYRDLTGPTICPFTSWQITRSLETLELRMIKSAESAQKIAMFLLQHPDVEKVIYPAVLGEKNPQFVIYQKQCLGPGSMISFYLKNGSEKKAFRFLNRLAKNKKGFKLAVSLGGTESLAEHPASTTHLAVPRHILKAAGVTDSIIRLSIGIEDELDLIKALEYAFG